MRGRVASFRSALLIGTGLTLGLLPGPGGALAQSFDSLQCYPIRDGAQHEFIRLDVVPSDAIFTDDAGHHVDPLAGTGCRLIVPARELCTAVSATETGNRHPTPGNPSPTPTAGSARPASSTSATAATDAGDFLCYAVACSESSDRVRLEVEDPFAARSIEVLNRPTQLCVPALRSAGTPTPGASGTPRPTSTPSASATPSATGTPRATSTPIPIQTPTPSPTGGTPGATPSGGTSGV